MSDELNIFLSYKMPKTGEEKVDIAAEFAKDLSDYAGEKINVHYAGAFAPGIDWRNEIIETIKKCDMFILLYTGEDQQWEFCLLEAGLFRAFYPDRPLVVFHDPSTPIPKALEDLNAVLVTVEHIINFLAPIFYDPPWEINPRLRRETLTHLAEALVKTFNYDKHVVTNFDLVPSFTLEMVASDSSRNQLLDGKIPEKTKLTGSQNWQVLFDKSTVADTFKWEDIKEEEWAVKGLYDLKLSRMVASAISQKMPGGCFIRPSIADQGGTLYRVALRRYEEYANKTAWRFYFTAAPIDIPIFGIGDAEDTLETKNYHLLNVCWYTRRKLILVLKKKAEALAADAMATPEQKKLLVAEIKDEIANINIQSFIRKIHHPAALEGILPLAEVQDDQKEWINSNSVFDTYQKHGNFGDVIQALAAMKVMNEKYYATSAVGFSVSVAAELKRSAPPASSPTGQPAA